MLTRSELTFESLEKFVKEQVIPNCERSRDSDAFPIELMQSLHRDGYLQAAIPKTHGGAGLSTLDLASIMRAIAYGSSGVMLSTMVNYLAHTVLDRYGLPGLTKKLFEEQSRDFFLWSFCVTEPEAGTDVARMKTAAKRVTGGFELSGQKCFITNANVSDHLLIFAQVPDTGVSVFYVAANSSGVSRGKPLKKMGQRDSDTGELFLDEVFVPERNVLGDLGSGLRILAHSIQRSKTLLAAGALGVSQRAMEIGVDFLAQREHYGKSLLSLPTVHQQLAQLQTENDAAWLLVCRAAATWDSGACAVKEASMAKLYCSETAARTVSQVAELFGGYGCTRDFEIERLYRDSHAFRIFEGASLVQQLIIAKELFPQIRSPRKERLKEAA